MSGLGGHLVGMPRTDGPMRHGAPLAHSDGARGARLGAGDPRAGPHAGGHSGSLPFTSPVTPPPVTVCQVPSSSSSSGLAHLANRLSRLRDVVEDELDRRPCLVSAYQISICDSGRNHHPSCDLTFPHVALSLRWEAPVEERLAALGRRLSVLRNHINSKYMSAEDAAVEALPHHLFFDRAVGKPLRCWAPTREERAAARVRAATLPLWQGDLHLDKNVFAVCGRLVEWDAAGLEKRCKESEATARGGPSTGTAKATLAPSGNSGDAPAVPPVDAGVDTRGPDGGRAGGPAGSSAAGATPKPALKPNEEAADCPPPSRPVVQRRSATGSVLAPTQTAAVALPRRLNMCRLSLAEVRSRVAVDTPKKVVLRLTGANDEAAGHLAHMGSWLVGRNRALRSRVIQSDGAELEVYIIPACAWTAAWLGVDCSTAGTPAAPVFCVAVRLLEDEVLMSTI